jgi:hypothetical protein
MRKLILLLLLLSLPALSEPADVIRDMHHEGREALIFSAELDIDNGNPYTRDKGERGMFGKLVFATDKDIPEYLDRADEIFAEAVRLLIGPLEGYGTTELEFCEVGRGIKLDLETGKWVKSKGGEAIRVLHTTEYMGGNRRAYILLDGLTIWRRK